MSESQDMPGKAIFRLGLLLLGLLGAGLALRTFSGGLEAELIDRLVIGQGPWGGVVFVLLAAAACASGVPRQATGFAAGYALGGEAFGGEAFANAWLGLALVIATIAQTLGCTMDFFWARIVARDWARARVRGRLARLEALFAGHPFSITLIIRLLPVGNNLAFSLLGGASSVRAGSFLVASALGYVPQTLVFVLLGSGARVAGWQKITLAGLLFAASAALGLWLYRRHRAMAVNAGL